MTIDELIESGRPMLVTILEDERRGPLLPGSETRACEICGRTVLVHESSLGPLDEHDAVIVCNEDAQIVFARDEREQMQFEDMSPEQLDALHEAGMSDDEIRAALALIKELAGARWAS